MFIKECFMFIFWSNEKVWAILTNKLFVRAVRLDRFVSSGVSAYQNLQVFMDRFGKRGEEKNCYAVVQIVRILFASLPPIVFVVFRITYGCIG